MDKDGEKRKKMKKSYRVQKMGGNEIKDAEDRSKNHKLEKKYRMSVSMVLAPRRLRWQSQTGVLNERWLGAGSDG